MSTLILLRHGQSQWNLLKRFTGWADVDLTEAGEAEARRGGELIKAQGIEVDRAFTSLLTRAIRTAFLALGAAEQIWVPMVKDWRLNERHYGALTGRDHADVIARHGEEQVKIWRRSYDIPPPPLEPGGDYDFTHDRRYRGIALPSSESLKTTLARVLPFWESDIAPHLGASEAVLVAAHGNSLRAIAKHLFAISDADITALEIPTGNPLVLELDAGLKPASACYLDPARAQALPTF